MDKIFKVVRLVFFLSCLCLFLIWLANALKSYLDMPKATNVSLKYGDDNKKNARFPSITFCKSPFVKMQGGGRFTMMVWKNNTACSKNSLLQTPLFLSYLEDCLESGTNETVSELIEKVTYNASEVFMSIDSRLLKNGNDLKNYSDKIIESRFHYNFGNCLTVDISSLSGNGNLFPMQVGVKSFMLGIGFYRVDPIVKQYFFLHNGSDINSLGRSNRGFGYTGGSYSVM